MAFRCAVLTVSIVLPGQVLGGEAACAAAGGAAGCDASFDEESSLLQRMDKRAGSVLQQAKHGQVTAKKAMALAGGGFLSLADFTGFAEGLMVGLKQKGQDASFGGLFEHYDTFSGISGGSWTLALWMYSASYAAMMEQAAAKPEQAGSRFNKDFIRPTLDAFDGTSLSGTAKGVLECIRKIIVPNLGLTQSSAGTLGLAQEDVSRLRTALPHLTPWDLQMLGELVILIQSGELTWHDVVRKMLLRGGGICPKLGMGTKRANRWAHGKLNIFGATAVNPPGGQVSGWGAFANIKDVEVYDTTGKHVISYTGTPDSRSTDGLLPIMFNVVVGAGTRQTSPVPICGAACRGYTANYSYISKGSNFSVETPFASTLTPAFDDSAGRVPVSSASASSSAFVGFTGLSADIGAKQGCAALSVWASNAKFGQSFKVAEQLRAELFSDANPSESLSSRLAQQGLNPLIDGGVVDMTGAAFAVAAGASEVLALVDLTEQWADFTSVSWLFNGGGSSAPNGIIFSEPHASVVEELFGSFPSIAAKSGSRFLQHITYGSVGKVVTASNPFFGIEAGRSVTLNVITIDTANITIGVQEKNYTFDSFYNYGELIQEIVDTLAESEQTQDILTKFFS